MIYKAPKSQKESGRIRIGVKLNIPQVWRNRCAIL